MAITLNTKPLNIITQLTQTVNWGLKIINAPQVWKDTKGEGIKVAVLDTGYSNHVDLLRNVKGYKNFTLDDFIDRNGHSTHCMGIIGAENNNFGVVGVAPLVELYSVKVLGNNGIGHSDWIAAGVMWCIENEMDIVSLSLGSSGYSEGLKIAVKEAHKRNVVLICAAGNESSGVSYPARFKETIAVGAISKEKTKATFSNWGDSLDFTAPGVNIYSTYLNNTYAILSGTSMATPFIAGICALIISKHRKYGGKTKVRRVEDVKEHLKKICNDLGEIGRDDYFGYGLPDLSKLG